MYVAHVGIIIFLLILLVFLYRVRENYATYESGTITIPDPEVLSHSTSGVAGISEGVSDVALSAFTGNWIYKSEDCLRQEVLRVELQNSLLQLTKALSIRYWYPPVYPSEPSILVEQDRFIIKPPPYRIIVVGDNALSLRSSSPTYAEMPSIMTVDAQTGILIYEGKKYISALKYKQMAKTLFPNCY